MDASVICFSCILDLSHVIKIWLDAFCLMSIYELQTEYDNER